MKTTKTLASACMVLALFLVLAAACQTASASHPDAPTPNHGYWVTYGIEYDWVRYDSYGNVVQTWHNRFDYTEWYDSHGRFVRIAGASEIHAACQDMFATGWHQVRTSGRYIVGQGNW